MDIKRYHVRADKLSDKTLEYIQEWIKKHDIKTYVISEEIGTETGKVHYQGFVDVDLAKRSEKTWRANFRDHLHVTGKNQYSFTIKHGNLEAYICKDGKIVLQSEDIHPLQIEQWKSESFQKVSKKQSEKTFAQKYIEEMKKLPSYDRDTLTYNTLLYFRDNTKVFDKFIIRRFVNLAMVCTTDDVSIRHWSHRIWDD